MWQCKSYRSQLYWPIIIADNLHYTFWMWRGMVFSWQCIVIREGNYSDSHPSIFVNVSWKHKSGWYESEASCWLTRHSPLAWRKNIDEHISPLLWKRTAMRKPFERCEKTHISANFVFITRLETSKLPHWTRTWTSHLDFSFLEWFESHSH